MPGIAMADSETERRLLRAKLTSTRDVEGWKVAPSVGLVYLEDAVHDDTSGATKAAGTGRVELMPEVSRRFQVDGDTFVEPRAAVGGFVGFEEFSALKPIVTTRERGRHAFEGGSGRRASASRKDPACRRPAVSRAEQLYARRTGPDACSSTCRSANERRMLRCIQFCQHCLYPGVTECYFACHRCHVY